jgi:hypothetical protein
MAIVIVGEGLSALSTYQILQKQGLRPLLIGPRISTKKGSLPFSKQWDHIYHLFGRANIWGGWLDFPHAEIQSPTVRAEAKSLVNVFEATRGDISQSLKLKGFKPKLNAKKIDFHLNPISIGNFLVQELKIEQRSVRAIRVIHAKTKKSKWIDVDHLILCASPFQNLAILNQSNFKFKKLGQGVGNHLVSAGVLLFEKKPFPKKYEVFQNFPSGVLELIGPKTIPKSFNEKKYKYFFQLSYIYNLKSHKN